MSEQKERLFSESVKAGSRTYFFDVKENINGDKYIVISESKKVGEDTFRRHNTMVFQEDLDKFANGLTKAIQFVQNNQKDKAI